MNYAVIIAGGVGSRMKNDVPKQFISVEGKPVLIYTLERFQNNPLVDEIIVACLDGWESVLWSYAEKYKITKLKYVIKGGETGYRSIRNCIEKLSEFCGDDDIAIIHDGIRPLVSEDLISNTVQTAMKFGDGVATIPCAEAMVYTEDGYVSTKDIPRDVLKRTQTPQAFKIGLMKDIYIKADELGFKDSTTFASLMLNSGGSNHLVAGSEKNIKLTTPDDMDIFKALLMIERGK